MVKYFRVDTRSIATCAKVRNTRQNLRGKCVPAVPLCCTLNRDDSIIRSKSLKFQSELNPFSNWRYAGKYTVRMQSTGFKNILRKNMSLLFCWHGYAIRNVGHHRWEEGEEAVYGVGI